MDLITLGAALKGAKTQLDSHFQAGSNILITDNPDGTQTIAASGEVSSEDTVARADIAAIKDGENIDSFADVETALGSKQDTISDLSTIRSGAALGATAVQPETGKGLSTNDYTTAEKTKLAGIAEGAEVNVQANWTQTTSTADDYIKNKPTLGTAAALDVAASGNASTSQVVKGNDTRLSDARNAADVSAWAKAANKPSYNGSEIALTGYTEAQSKSSVAATDTANAAIGKLEYRVETNENNILLSEKLNGRYNLAETNNATFTRDTYIRCALKANVSYYLRIGSFTSEATGVPSQILFYKGSQQVGAIEGGRFINHGDDVSVVFTPNSVIDSIRLYSGNDGSASDNKSATFTNLCIIEKSVYDSGLTQYVPFSLSNEDLTDFTLSANDEGFTQKNLFSPTITTGSIFGYNYTVSNGVISITSGTNQSTQTITLGTVTLPKGTYYLSGCADGGEDSKYRLDVRSGASVITGVYDSSTISSFSLNTETTLTVIIRVQGGYSFSTTAVFKPMISKINHLPFQPHSMSNVELTEELNPTAYTAPRTNTNYNITIESGGYFVCGKICFINVRLTVGTDIPTNTYFLYDLPEALTPSTLVAGSSICALSNNRGVYISVASQGNVLNASGAAITSGLVVLTGAYLIK